MIKRTETLVVGQFEPFLATTSTSEKFLKDLPSCIRIIIRDMSGNIQTDRAHLDTPTIDPRRKTPQFRWECQDAPKLTHYPTLLLRQSLQSDIIAALAMEEKFHLNQLSQTLEHARLGQEELQLLSHQILAAQETDGGDTRRK